MRTKATWRAVLPLLMLVVTSSAYADEFVLWDNYPGDVLQYATVNMTSERNTEVVEPTWIVDDVDFGVGLSDPADYAITRLEWIGARDPGHAYGTADVIMFNDFPDLSDHGGYSVEFEGADLAYTFEDLDPDPNPDPDTTTYKGSMTFDTPLSLSDLGLGPHFYVGVRLVGSGYLQGRNHMVTASVDQTLQGQTEGYNWAPSFGAPYWRPASDVWFGVPDGTTDENFEFAFRIYGIPEPTSLGLLLIGSILLLVRRRVTT